MAETILPGTYITVRDEGLISTGSIATGNIGIVGTASKGPINEVVLLSSFSEAKEIFGEADEWQDGSKNELTLVRALEYIYKNGGRAVYAVRTAKDAGKSSYKIADDTGKELTKLEAITQGAWGDDLAIEISEAPESAIVQEEIDHSSTIKLKRNIEKNATINTIQIKKANGRVITLAIQYESGVYARPTANPLLPDETVVVNTDSRELLFTTTLNDFNPQAGDKILARYRVLKDETRKIEISYGQFKETYIIADAPHLEELIKSNKSRLVTAETLSSTVPEDRYGKLPKVTTSKSRFGIGSTGDPGSNGESADSTDYATSLRLLEEPDVNIVLLAGQDASKVDMNTVLLGHINSTKEIKRERIGLTGCNDSSDSDSIITQKTFAEDRIIFVGPGLHLSNGAKLSGAFTAAAVAGLLASLPVQASPTNKTINIPGLIKKFNSANLERLVQNRVLAVEYRDGYRIVKGITTSSNSAWHQITTRRIVDYAIRGVRSGCNPYIGKLNNERVRNALKATIDSFLTRMVNDEALTSYELTVTATRPQEIEGQVMVTMTLKPTFSIDFIMVTMYLN
jgi:phage tail sheath protein FI